MPILNEYAIISELEEVKSLLVRTCPDWVIGDITTPRPLCCPYHHAAQVVADAQKILKESLDD